MRRSEARAEPSASSTAKCAQHDVVGSAGVGQLGVDFRMENLAPGRAGRQHAFDGPNLLVVSAVSSGLLPLSLPLDHSM